MLIAIAICSVLAILTGLCTVYVALCTRHSVAALNDVERAAKALASTATTVDAISTEVESLRKTIRKLTGVVYRERVPVIDHDIGERQQREARYAAQQHEDAELAAFLDLQRASTPPGGSPVQP